jgi:hypothetical protein
MNNELVKFKYEPKPVLLGERSNSSENLKFFRYHLRDPVMIYVVAL